MDYQLFQYIISKKKYYIAIYNKTDFTITNIIFKIYIYLLNINIIFYIFTMYKYFGLKSIIKKELKEIKIR